MILVDTGPLLIPATVATEVCILLERRRGPDAELALLSDVRAGRYTLIESLSVDLGRVAELVAKYEICRWALWTPR